MDQDQHSSCLTHEDSFSKYEIDMEEIGYECDNSSERQVVFLMTKGTIFDTHRPFNNSHF